MTEKGNFGDPIEGEGDWPDGWGWDTLGPSDHTLDNYDFRKGPKTLQEALDRLNMNREEYIQHIATKLCWFGREFAEPMVGEDSGMPEDIRHDMELAVEQILARQENPTPADIKQWMSELSDTGRPHIHIIKPLGTLSIYAKGMERVNVFFKSKSPNEYLKPPKVARILDPAHLDINQDFDNEGNYRIKTDHPRETITKAKALEVAIYYLQHETLPRDLIWDKPMDEFVD